MGGDPLFNGITRPETFFGIPYSALLVGILGAVTGLAITSNPQWLLVFFPFVTIVRVLTANEPRLFHHLRLYIGTKMQPSAHALIAHKKVLTWTSLPRRRY